MRKLSAIVLLLACLQLKAQDSLQTKTTQGSEKKAVPIFSSEKVVNANTPETVGAGKMAFKVMHNFGDIAGDFGGLKNFFGLDNAVDVKIGFVVGVLQKFRPDCFAM